MKRLALGLLVLATCASIARGDVINVPADYTEIQDAIQAAGAGDVVQVAAGTYSDCTHETEGPGSTPACVIMKSGVTLRGAGVDATIIDANALGRGIFIENVSNCKVENLQVREAFATVYGAGVLIRGVGSSVELTDVKVVDCTDGGIICIDYASPVLTRVQCLDNVAKQGGGLSIEEYSSPQVLDCVITGNTAPSGAGIFIRNHSDAIISRSVISGNIIDSDFGQGGGIFINESSPYITNCEISGNLSRGNGGGLSYQLGSAGKLENCEIIGNELVFDYITGAGIALDSSSPEIVGCLIAGNICSGVGSNGAGVSTIFPAAAPSFSMCTIAFNETSPGSSAGGVLAEFGSAPSFDRCIIAGAVTGAGLACGGGTPVVSCSDVWGNAGGDAICGTDGGGNISQDPQFCAVDDYGLSAGSPCLSVCGGPIGAKPVGCGFTDAALPSAGVELLGNHPNPFNPSTAITFRLDAPGEARVRICDVSGRTVTTLTLGDLPAGRHEVVWDGKNAAGAPASSGVYLYEIEALNTRQTRRMILIK